MNETPWEDNLLERKLESDLKDLLKTLVAFGNSVKPGHKAVILIGERDDGSVAGISNPDNIQKKIREECDKVYPNLLWRSLVYQKENKFCVRVEIEYSGETPHFAGPAWIRRGSETIKASDEVFQRLIETRTDFVRALTEWVGKEVTVFGDEGTIPPPQDRMGPRTDLPVRLPFAWTHKVFSHRWQAEDTIATLVIVNKFWITLQLKESGQIKSEPISKLTLSFDDTRKQLKIIVSY